MKNRIKYLLDREKVTSSQFASEIGIAASSLHHIISGRNNPSLEVIQKILERFPQINAEWLINGKGNTFKTMVQGELFDLPEPEAKSNNEDIQLIAKAEKPSEIVDAQEKEIIQQIIPSEAQSHAQSHLTNKNSKISKIIILYEDGTFDMHLKR